MDDLLLEPPHMIDSRPDKFSSYNKQLPPRPSLSPSRTTSPIGDERRSPYFRTHSPLIAYESNRETIVRRDRSSPTLAETHLICKEGSNDSFYSEEHWSSEVSAFVTTSPPKFLQVIKPYRVRNIDQFTLVVEVRSDPPAHFVWFFNDRLIPVNSSAFVIRNMINASTLTVADPKEGLYACAASNPAGTSKTYGYVTVNHPKKQIKEKTFVGNFPPEKHIQFVSQVPNLTIKPGGDLQFDIEVNTTPNTKFTWFIDDKPTNNVEISCPSPNRCLSRFRNAQPGKYTICASNEFGSLSSTGYITAQFDRNSYDSDISLQSLSTSMDESLLNRDNLIGIRRARSVRSVGRNAGLLAFPSKPKFIQVPSIIQQLNLKGGETLIANVNVLAEPAANIHWYINKFELRNSDIVQINRPAENASTLIHKQPPSGIYRIRATNPHGSAVYEMRVTIDGYSGKSSFLSSQSSFSNDEDSLLGMSAKKPEGIKDDLPKAPKLISAFPNFHRIKEGRGIVLEVRVDAIPEATFLWKQNNFELKNGQHGVSIVNPELNVSLLNLEKPIDGRIEVMASNKLGRCSASTKIVIDYALSDSENRFYFVEALPPTFSANSTNFYVKVNTRQPGHFEWRIDDRQLKDTDGCKITQDSFQSSLTLPLEFASKHELRVSFTNSIGTIHSKSRLEDRKTAEPPPVPKKQFRIVNGAVQRVTEKNSTEQKDANVIEVEKINQDFIETTQIEKQEESYSLLVKVAETIAERLVVNIIMEAIKESAHRLSRLYASSESESEEESFLADHSRSGLEPTFVNSNETFYCLLNETITLSPRLKGNDFNSAQWFKEGMRLRTQSDLELTLRNVQIGEAGGYECRVSNTYGVSSYFCRLIVRNLDGGMTVRSPSPNYIDTIQNINTKIVINQKDDERAIEVLLADDVFAAVEFTISEDIEINAVLKLGSSIGQQGTVISVDIKDNGPIYQTDNKPPRSSNYNTKSSHILRTEEINIDSNFYNWDQNQILRFENAPQHEQNFTISFIQQDVAFVRVESLIENTKDGFEILVDSGICISLSESVKFSTSAQLSKSVETPKFIEKLSDVTVQEGSSPQLTCTISGSPSVKWLFNEKEIKDESNKQIFSSHGILGLRFHKICALDEGLYTCQITNLCGSSSTRAYLRVIAAQSEKDKRQGPISQSNTVETPDAKSSRKRRSKSAERFYRLRINAMDSLRHFGQRLQRIRDRSFTRNRRSRSSQPVPVESRAALPQRQHSSDLDSNQFYFYNNPKQEATENYTIHKYFDSEYKTKVITTKDTFSTDLNTLATDDRTLARFEDFYKTPTNSTNTIRRRGLPKDITPIQRYVDTICNFDNLMEWMRNSSRELTHQSVHTTYSAFERQREEYALHTTKESQLEECIRRVEQKQVIVEKDEIIRDDNFMLSPIQHIEEDETIRQDNFMLSPIQHALPSIRPVEEEPTQSRHRILHGKVLPVSGKISPAYLLRTNSTCNAGLTTDISQEWSLQKDDNFSHAEAFFIPYAQSRTEQNVEDPRPKVVVTGVQDEKLAELEDYVQRQLRLMDRETQTTPRLRQLANQTPTESPILNEKPTTSSTIKYDQRHFQTLPSRKQGDSDNLTLLKQTLLEVERDAIGAQRRFHKTMSEDALLIEKTILKVSEELQKRGPLSDAQLLASEELLRSKIAEAILNLKPSIPTGYDTSSNNTPTIDDTKITDHQMEQIDILRDPILTLKEKLGRLEKHLIYDEEESIREELQQINSLSDSHEVKLREKSVRSRTESVARMTPLIVLVKNKLSHLNSAVDQQAAAKRSKTPVRFISDENSRSIHRLLLNIGEEVSKIHTLCRENKKIDSVNLVVEVLAKVCKSIDAILEGFHRNEDLSEMSTSLTISSQAPATNVTVKLNKPEQIEETNTLLMYWSGGDETHNLSVQVDSSLSKPEMAMTTNASVKVQEFAHVKKNFDAAVKTDVVFKRVENREEVPEIKLITPSLAAKKSKVESEIGINVQNKSEVKHVETLLVNQSVITANERIDTPPLKVKQLEDSIIIVRRKNAEFSSPTENLIDEDASVSENVDVPILFATNRSSLVIPTRETDIISSDDDTPHLQVVDIQNNVWEKFKLKKHRRNYKVNAFIYPAVRFQLIATVSGSDFEVVVDCDSEYFYDSVVVLADSFYASQAYVPDNQTKRDSSDFSDEDTLEAIDQPDFLNNYSRMSVSINARSVNDAIQAFLEEVPWNGVSATVQEVLDIDQFVEARNSGLFGVTVSENQDESRSLKSHESSQSQKSLAISEQFSQQSMDVPTYVIKQNSTATITVELNPFVQKNAKIEWFRGRKHINFSKMKQKYNRIREDHLEILVINNVQSSDSELFSITVNKDIYPVAYLIIEDNSMMKENRYFVSPFQTNFVMQGQTAILSCQLVNPNMNVTWYKGDELLMNDEKHTFQQGEDNWYRVIISDISAEDQGIYYAFVENCSISVNLVVEEPIDEKEVQISDAEDHELSDYLIPQGSNATIACELDYDSVADFKNLIWQKDNRPIELANQNKFEYVINGAKHFLILHNASIEDSGIYSVLIANNSYNIAKISIGQNTQLAGSRLRQISNSSICI